MRITQNPVSRAEHAFAIAYVSAALAFGTPILEVGATAIDTTYGDGGFVQLDFPAYVTPALDAASGNGGELFIAGTSQFDGINRCTVAKLTADGSLAVTPAIDSHRSVLESMGCAATVPIPLLFAHAEGRRKSDTLDQLRVGEVYSLTKTPDAVVIEASFDDTRAANHAWALLKSGEVRCLSVHSENEQLRGLVDGVRYYYSWEIQEISMCRAGANPDARFVISADYEFDW